MTSGSPGLDQPLFLPRERLGALISELQSRGYIVVGPVIRQAAIVYDELYTVDDLPRGWTDLQEAGTYRLERRADEQYFGYVVGPHSWKQFLFPPVATVATAVATEAGWNVTAADGRDAPQFAFFGMRACELAAVAVQDRVFIQKDYADPIYKARRDKAFFVAVNCTQAAPTCFCASMNTGPRCTVGFDLALTEIDDGFVVEIGGERGRNVIVALGLAAATNDALRDAEAARRRAADGQTRSMPTEGLRDLLVGNPNHPRWTEVAERCLSCTNCTQVCPTCFCSSVREVTDLDVRQVERRREWDSCFNFDFSYMNGGVVRNSVRSRYRQWLTHKLATWHDQFGESGCVGCGRCITWCPVEIDLTAEVAAIRGDVS
ncbi:MAG: 4Fe-4S dicluster domain-containing protein [Planctomycetes bacterium]|nr:4Fe-4S dicluster domain-containing protein [Planctomycetota bacterium]